MVAKFLSVLDADLRPIHDSLLSSDNVPTLSNALSRVLCVTTNRPDSILTDNSAMYARGPGHGGRGQGRAPNDRPCDHCGRFNHVSERCWEKFGIPDWANMASVETSSCSVDISSAIASTTVASASTSAGAYALSHGKSWMLDSGASAHITGTKTLFTSFATSSSSFPLVRLVDGTYSPITGTSVVKPTTNVTLGNVLLAPNFPVSLLSIIHLAKSHNCYVTFYPSYCVFHDLHTKRMIGGRHERGGLYYFDSIAPVSS